MTNERGRERTVSDADLGLVVCRVGRDEWHRIESVIDDDAVTRCGRRMAHMDARGRGLRVAHGDPTCAYCA